jgi:hypothetical protein
MAAAFAFAAVKIWAPLARIGLATPKAGLAVLAGRT